MPAELEARAIELAKDRGDFIELGTKAARFTQLIERHHRTPEGLYAYRVPFPYQDAPPAAVCCDALGWTALLAVAQALEMRVQPTEDALLRLEQTLRGLDHLARISGTKGLLARTMIAFDEAKLEQSCGPRCWVQGTGSHRGLDYSQYLWKNDNAKAQVQYWLFALRMGLPLVRDEALRADLLDDVRAVCQRIATADFYLTEADGRRTRFGDLNPAARGRCSWFLGLCIRSPVDLWPFCDFAVGPNAVETACLARVHDQLLDGSGIPHESLYDLKMRRRAPELISEGFYRVPGWVRYDNEFLAAVGLWCLLETDPGGELEAAVLKALRSHWRLHQHDRNTLFNLIALKAGVVPEQEREKALREALFSLQIYPSDRVVHSIDRRKHELVRRPLNSSRRAAHPLPINLMASSSIVWHCDPAELVKRCCADGELANGSMDYLLAWWLYRDLVALERMSR